MSEVERLLDILFPKKCVHCGVTGSYLCDACFYDVSFLSHQFCPACHKQSVLGFSSHGCCKRTYLSQLYSVCWYRGVAASLVSALKYNRPVRAVIEVFDELILRSVTGDIGYDWEQAVYVPVPLHKRKLRDRGFNQSRLLADILSKHMGGKVCADMVTRTKDTIPQASLSKEFRRKNISDAFEWTGMYKPNGSSRVVIVDDVYTSGGTINECAKVLKRSGVKIISAFTFARG